MLIKSGFTARRGNILLLRPHLFIGLLSFVKVLRGGGGVEVCFGLDGMGSSIDGVLRGDDDVLDRTGRSHHWCCEARCVEHR